MFSPPLAAQFIKTSCLNKGFTYILTYPSLAGFQHQKHGATKRITYLPSLSSHPRSEHSGRTLIQTSLVFQDISRQDISRHKFAQCLLSSETNFCFTYLLRFEDDIEYMIGSRPGWYWKITWRFVAPFLVFSILVASIVNMGIKPIVYSAWHPELVSKFSFYFLCSCLWECGLPVNTRNSSASKKGARACFANVTNLK